MPYAGLEKQLIGFPDASVIMDAAACPPIAYLGTKTAILISNSDCG